MVRQGKNSSGASLNESDGDDKGLDGSSGGRGREKQQNLDMFLRKSQWDLQMD